MADESLVSILNAIQENIQYIDRIVPRLEAIASKLDELDGTRTSIVKIKRAEQRLSSIESEFSSLSDYFSSSGKKLFPTYSPPVAVQFDNWEDFRSESIEATMVSFLMNEKEKTFQVYASRQGRILTYRGELPENKGLLKSWISNELNASRTKVIEGILALG